MLRYVATQKMDRGKSSIQSLTDNKLMKNLAIACSWDIGHIVKRKLMTVAGKLLKFKKKTDPV